LQKLSELPLQLEPLLGVLLDVTVSVKGTGDQARVNIYLNKRVERTEDQAAPASRSAATPSGGSRGLSRF